MKVETVTLIDGESVVLVLSAGEFSVYENEGGESTYVVFKGKVFLFGELTCDGHDANIAWEEV